MLTTPGVSKVLCLAVRRSLHGGRSPITAAASAREAQLRCRRFASASTDKDNTKSPDRLIDDKVQYQLENPDWIQRNVPNRLLKIAVTLRHKLTRDPVDAHLKVLLDAASSQLALDCCNNFDYSRLCKSFGLPDYFSSWYKIMLMHQWMILMRLHVSLEAQAYERFKYGLLTAMWMDVDNRLEIHGKEIGIKLNERKDMLKMHGLYTQSLMEYDEGFLADDVRLAGAIWRNLYIERTCDPVHVASVIAYMRSTMAWLDSLDQMDILADGIKEWKRIGPYAAVL